MYAGQFSNLVVSIIMLVSGYNNIILLPNFTLLYYVFSGPLSLCAYVPEIKFNKKIKKYFQLKMHNEEIAFEV